MSFDSDSSGGPGPTLAPTSAATFCATLVDEWVRSGATAAFVAPGSRSTPLAVALATHPETTVSVFHDERAAGFAALGWALRSGRPAIALCSSGTAGSHFYAAVIEASLSAIPLIVVTADRPPELWDVGAAQTIDQTNLFGGHVRWFAQPGVPDHARLPTWRSWGSRAVVEALGGVGRNRPGPVHLNLSFRDPLAGIPGDLPPGRPDGRPWHDLVTPADRRDGAPGLEGLPDLTRSRGVIVAGGGVSDPARVIALARRLGWPLLADHRSGCREPGVAVAHFDGLLRHHGFAAAHSPELIIRFGEPLASKILGLWLARSGAPLIVGAPDSRWLDPDRAASLTLPEKDLAAAMLAIIPSDHLASDAGGQWQEADARADAAIETVLDEDSAPNDPAIARAVIAALPRGAALVAASSMAVREIEWFGANRSDLEVYANRGANGIDGTIATAIGIASTGVPTACLVGDVAFLHDSTALIDLARRPIDLTIVVLDNDGGGIFGFLPQHDLLAHDQFELLFGTPHGTDLGALTRAHHLECDDWVDHRERVDLVPRGVRVFIARTDREAGLLLHRALNNAIVAAIG